VIVAGLLIFACASLLGLAAWVVILPPRERNGFEDLICASLRGGSGTTNAAAAFPFLLTYEF
jgi:hypothetical protein